MENTNYAHEYIHMSSIGDRDECLDALCRTDALMQQCYAEGGIQGHQAYLIANEADREMNFLEANVDDFTAGRYPYLYAFVQSKAGGVSADPVLTGLGYTRVA